MYNNYQEEIKAAGKRLASIQKIINHTDREMAEILCISVSHYRKIKRGGCPLTEDKCFILINALNVSMDYFFRGEEWAEMFVGENQMKSIELTFEVLDQILERYILSLPEEEKVCRIAAIMRRLTEYLA